LIKAGGKVVKNVAGYDLCKLFIGARHSLGIIVEGTFKLRPLPELEIFLETRVDTLADLARLRSALLATPAEPVLIDGHNLNGPITLTIAFAGPREDVHYQASIAESLGFAQTAAPLDRQEFWNGPPPQKASVLATRTVETIMRIAPAQFLAHIGNGIIYYRGGSAPVSEPMPLKLMERVKNTYDPRRILPDYAA
jgi:FAD/FMN-containing dehydrogenase